VPFAGDAYVSQQDTAPAHRVRQTVELLQRETRSSSVLMMLIITLWGVMLYRVYQTPVQDVGDLRQCLVDTWSGFSQRIADDAVDEWQNRFQVYVNERGGHFEHLL